MVNEFKKKYGIFTAVAMVVGIVIGSGVFFKAEKILETTSGNLTIALIAWLIGGLIMVICAYTFSVLATKYEKVNGIIDYAEATVGKKYGYYIGWFIAVIYYPTITSALAWVTALYTGQLFGFAPDSAQVLTLAGFFLIVSYAVNSLSPKLAGKFQVTTTVIKIIPLILIAVVGTIAGFINGVTIENFNSVISIGSKSNFEILFIAVCATAFAYEGWIIATSINAELKDAKKNMPKALFFGTIFIVIIYMMYYMGISGALTTSELIGKGSGFAFVKTFGNVFGTLLTVFVAISCMGTLNGLMLGCTRGFYSLAARKEGPAPQIFNQIDSHTNMTTNSSIMGLLLCSLWLVYFYGTGISGFNWFGPIKFDQTELPIITIYALYIPIFVLMMVKEKSFNGFRRFVMPALAILSSIFMMIASVFSHGINVLWYLITFAIIMLIGMFIKVFSKQTIK